MSVNELYSNSKYLVDIKCLYLYTRKGFVLRRDHLSTVPTGIEVIPPDGHIGVIYAPEPLSTEWGVDVVSPPITGDGGELTIYMTSRKWKFRTFVKEGSLVGLVYFHPIGEVSS